MKEIHTSSVGWLKKALNAYTAKLEFKIVDDADVGLSEKDVQSAVQLIKFAKNKRGFGLRQLAQLLASIGITGAGVWIVAAAIADPEPKSKLGLLISGGIILALTGSLGTLRSLGMKYRVTAKVLGREFHIHPED